jgi:hypothetical protein
MSFPSIEKTPDDPQRLPPARRRRARRLLLPFNADEREAFLDHIYWVSPWERSADQYVSSFAV